MIASDLFMVVGMSFECDTDRFLLYSLGKVEDDMPIGESTWLIVNHNSEALKVSCAAIQQRLPRAKVIAVRSGFSDWQANDYQELKQIGGIA